MLHHYFVLYFFYLIVYFVNHVRELIYKADSLLFNCPCLLLTFFVLLNFRSPLYIMEIGPLFM